MLFSRQKSSLPGADEALRGRDTRPFSISGTHTVLHTPIEAEPPTAFAEVTFGMGCFWGAERIFWQTPGVWTTAVGYAGGQTANPTYEETCSGKTGHAEVVRVVFDPSVISFDELLRIFWESHDPTQGFRQGNDFGTQYRSTLYYTSDAQKVAAQASRDAYEKRLQAVGYKGITTEIAPAGTFYYAEDYHQQYLYKNPNGYCGIGGTGVACAVGLGVSEA